MIKNVHVVFGKGRGSQKVTNDKNRQCTNVEEVLYIVGATLLGCLRDPQCNLRDAPDEESLTEPARFPRYVWGGKRYNQSKA
jgi:hypothetical protein